MSAVPAGYQLQVTTWENDGDAYKTQIISGLTEIDVKFYLEIASKFTSRNAHGKSGLGNGGVSAEDIIRVVQEALEKYPDISSAVDAHWSPDMSEHNELDHGSLEEFMSEVFYENICSDILGYPVDEYYWEEDNFCRVFSDFKVIYFDSPGVDVTEKFEPK